MNSDRSWTDNSKNGRQQANHV